MNLSELIRQRRSIHRFEQRAVPEQLVAELLDTAVWAPNHHMTQPWRFVITSGAGMIRIAEAARRFNEGWQPDPEKKAATGQRYYDKIMGNPLIVTVVMQEHPDLQVREEDYGATATVIHNFSLLAWEQGIGMVWETYPWLHASYFREAMGITPGERVVGNLHIGYPAVIPRAQQRVPAAERITYITTPSDAVSK